MNRFANTRFRLLILTLAFLAIGPMVGLIFNADDVKDYVWMSLMGGAVALMLAWIAWSERYRKASQAILTTARKISKGDYTARTGLKKMNWELEELARHIDALAVTLQERTRQHEQTERTLLNRSHQQTLVAALGQFAMSNSDFNALLDQAVNFVTQTLEIEYCGVWKVNPEGNRLTLRAGVGWKDDSIGWLSMPSGSGTMIGLMFSKVEPLVVMDLPGQKDFPIPKALADHGVVSCVSTKIIGDIWSYGVLGVYSTKPRKFTEDEIHFLISIATVIAIAVNRRQSEAKLVKMAAFAERNPNPVMEFSADGELTYFNDATMTMANTLGYDHPNHFIPAEVRDIVLKCVANRQSRLRYETNPGNRTLSWSFFPIGNNQAVHCYVGDITERRQEEAERHNLETQLRQSQKMESIGQLAAGVAHDFNNMLTIIQGHSGIIMARQSLPPELVDSAQSIYFAAERAASLTRQLLLFSRKNIAQPQLLDLRETVGNMTKMLQRLLGENITLKYVPPAALPAIHADAGMVEQVVMNLSVNARDAMPKGGILTINLSAHNLGRAHVQLHPQAWVGQFVRLQVTDSGHGMTPEVQARIFEPFYTTKEVGKGTGLGLATVYGIVKQHEGWIDVTSEVEKGTTFEVYFPASHETVAQPVSPAVTTRTRGGKETILVVEDEAVLRDLARLILKEHGYQVLEAASSDEALAVWESDGHHVDLLLTDMVMPNSISGCELAKQLRARKPTLKVICVSGYSMDEVPQDGELFLQKPYTRLSLAKAVRDCLDG